MQVMYGAGSATPVADAHDIIHVRVSDSAGNAMPGVTVTLGLTGQGGADHVDKRHHRGALVMGMGLPTSAVYVLLSIVLAGPRIALASGTAFLTAQLLDIWVFDRLRRLPWWQAPLISSAIASIWDTAVFFGLAFAGTGLPWLTWGLGDLGVKAGMALLLLLPFRALMGQRDALAAPAR